MLLRALAFASLLLTLLAPAALADSDHGGGGSISGQDLQLASGVTSVTVGGNAALTCTSQPSQWSAAISGSDWVSPNADCTTSLNAGDYTYAASFTLPSGASSLQLTGSVLADDSVTISLNGTTIFSSGGSFTAASAFGATSGFQTGTNTLTFTVHNNGGPSGLDFAATVTGTGLGSVGPSGTHGQCVAAVAHSTGRGRGHGEAVRDAAHSCPHGDSAGDD